MQGPEVMLASTITDRVGGPERVLETLAGQGWWGEVKWDGVRAVVAQQDGVVSIFNRRRTNITHRYPDVVASVAGHWDGVLDGEIITLIEGRPDFTGIHRRDAQSSPDRIARMAHLLPATFMPFDALEYDGVNLRDAPYEDRRGELERMTATWATVSPAHRDLPTLWQFVNQQGLEGLVLKRPGSLYRPGRQKAWVKVKATHSISAIVIGVKTGVGARGQIGSLSLGLWNPATREMVNIGSVGSGMSMADLKTLSTKLGPGQPPLVIEVEYLEVSRDGRLRMPVYKGIRSDVHPTQVTIDSLPDSAAS